MQEGNVCSYIISKFRLTWRGINDVISQAGNVTLGGDTTSGGKAAQISEYARRVLQPCLTNRGGPVGWLQKFGIHRGVLVLAKKARFRCYALQHSRSQANDVPFVHLSLPQGCTAYLRLLGWTVGSEFSTFQ